MACNEAGTTLALPANQRWVRVETSPYPIPEGEMDIFYHALQPYLWVKRRLIARPLPDTALEATDEALADVGSSGGGGEAEGGGDAPVAPPRKRRRLAVGGGGGLPMDA